jgi:hypothetical protein
MAFFGGGFPFGGMHGGDDDDDDHFCKLILKISYFNRKLYGRKARSSKKEG